MLDDSTGTFWPQSLQLDRDKEDDQEEARYWAVTLTETKTPPIHKQRTFPHV